MAKQQKRKSDAKIGYGGVTDVQIAFLVDCYLKDRNYTKSLHEFRSEASSVLAPFKSEPPREMMSLRAILNDYVVLKEQVLSIQREKVKMDQFFAGVKDMVNTYEKIPPVVYFLPPSEAPPTTTGEIICGVSKMLQSQHSPSTTGVTTKSTKRKAPPKTKEAPLLEITNTATGTKRIRHGPVIQADASASKAKTDIPNTPLQSKKIQPNVLQTRIPHLQASSASVSPCMDPQTPQQLKTSEEGMFQVPQVHMALRTPYANADVQQMSCEPSKKRQPVKPTTSKCKSLNFTSEPAQQEKPSADLLTSSNEVNDIFCNELFSAGPLTSIDDILGTSLDGTAFSELMNSMLVDDLAQEINSPVKEVPESESLPCDPGKEFLNDVICLEDEPTNKTTQDSDIVKIQPSKPSRKASGKENAPPKRSRR